jgi:two-component system NtrC family sensor kinase
MTGAVMERPDDRDREQQERPAPTFEVADATPDDTDRSYRRLVDDALDRRPRFSIRAKIILAFGSLFLLCACVNLWFMVEISEFRAKVQFLDVAGDYLAEIQQARRYEKNYLLYGTNLVEAQQHTSRAQSILNNNQRVIEKIVGVDRFRTMLEHLVLYSSLLRKLDGEPTVEEKRFIEGDLREHGATMVLFAADFERKEQAAVESTLRLAQWTPVLFLGLLMVLVVGFGVSLGRQLLSTLSRFMKYTQRVGEGDFTPIEPTRRYQDEFTVLARAFNHMIEELDRRHSILVESHKLRAVGTLVAGVAHELNNPLNNTLLTADMLQEVARDKNDAESLELITDIVDQTERSSKIVHNLLDFARESKANVKHLDIGQIVNKSIGLVDNQVKLAKIDLRVQIPEGLPTVDGDAQMLSQVFVNLILNAVDVLPPAGRIRILAHESLEEEGFVAIDVSDNGPGIPAHILSQIFDPFFTTKKEGKGTGLGLSVSRGIVRKLGGFLKARSTVGKGTTFTVLLPVTRIVSGISSEQRKLV